MKIAIYNDWWAPQLVGGAERTALDLALKLAQEFGPENINIFTPSNSSNSSFEIRDDLRVSRLKSNTWRSDYSIGLFRKIFEKIRIVFDQKFVSLVIDEVLSSEASLLILHNIDRLGLSFVERFRAKSQIPIIRIQHDLGDSCIYRTRMQKITKSNCSNTCISCKFKENIFRNQSKNYDTMISVSKFVESTYQRLGFSPIESFVGYPNHENVNIEAGRYFFCNSNNIRLGFIGRVVPEKGIESVLHAMAIIKTDYKKNVSLYICGTGSERYLRKLEKIASRIKVELNHLGASSDPYNLLADKIDAVVVPSIWQEPLGRVPMECVSRGIPCFVSNIGGLIESREWLGGPIIFYESSNSLDLAAKITLALEEGIEVLDSPKSYSNLNEIIIRECKKFASRGL